MRVSGSVRFADYYKVQWYNDAPGMHVWVDIQRQYPTEALARAAFPRRKRCRVMMVTEAGRAPLPDAVPA